uniref:Chorion peroxidase n=1 Tax=Angiostrongylus cantonensis TaxID=6313 RepID=A0A158PCN5_ANGCA
MRTQSAKKNLGLGVKELRHSEWGALDDICPLRYMECNTTKYRSACGICNNVLSPHYGAALNSFHRALPPDYGDGIASWKLSVDSDHLPHPNHVARLLFRSTTSHSQHQHMMPITSVSALFVQWSRFLYDDMVSIVPFRDAEGKIPVCCPEPDHPECAPLYDIDADRITSQLGCQVYVRSQMAPASRCNLGPRQQMNMASSFIDAGPVYGSSKEVALEKRAKKHGTTSLTDIYNFIVVVHPWCPDTYEAINILLAFSFELNPTWADEQLYQEARRIIIAQIQFITVNEYLPLLIGKETMENYKIADRLDDFTNLYNELLNSNTLNSFAAGVGEFFLTMQSSSSIYQTPPLIDEKSLLFEPVTDPGLNSFNAEFFPSDLLQQENGAAILIHRSRDHGIPGYVKWREYCGGGKVSSFDELESIVIDPHHLLPILTSLYRSVEDVDLLVLALAEKPVRGSLVGPTLGCILALQYQKVSLGDRFWFTNNVGDEAFSLQQLRAITSGTKLSYIMCQFLGIHAKVQPNAFLLHDKFDNYPVLCNSSMHGGLSLTPWRNLPVEFPTVDNDIQRLLQKAEDNIRQKRKQIQQRVSNSDSYPVTQRSSPSAYSYMMRAKETAAKLSAASEVLLEATMLLASSRDRDFFNLGDYEKNRIPKVNLDWFISQYSPPDKCLTSDLPCDHTTKYRLHSGWCNNLQSPELGNAFQPFLHLLPPQYDDAMIEATIKSNVLMKKKGASFSFIRRPLKELMSQEYSHMLMQFGQFVGHDITHSPLDQGPNGEDLNCTRCDSFFTVSQSCMPVRVPENDPFFSPFVNGGPRCLEFIRSLNGQRQLGPRTQINQITAFLDGSVIYGSTACEAGFLRAKNGGKLRENSMAGRFERKDSLLPPAEDQSTCLSAPFAPCFASGDERVSQHPGITVMHIR